MFFFFLHLWMISFCTKARAVASIRNQDSYVEEVSTYIANRLPKVADRLGTQREWRARSKLLRSNPQEGDLEMFWRKQKGRDLVLVLARERQSRLELPRSDPELGQAGSLLYAHISTVAEGETIR